MNAKNLFLLLVAAILIPATFFQNTVLATEQTLSVRQSDATCTQTAETCFPTIQSAVDYVNGILTASTGTSATFSIQVEAGTYTETITLGIGITTLKGTETARTILSGGGSGTLLTVSGGNPTISNFTFRNAQIGINIINTVSAQIQNNVFTLGQNGTAVQALSSTAQTNISHNTFYVNNIAINSSIEIPIKNNVFYSNNTAPAPPAPSQASTASLIAKNDFFANTYPPSQLPDAAGNIFDDPAFVDAPSGDFHLKAGSPCINLTDGDMGAYGSSTDTVPFQVAGVQAALASAASSTISVSWTPNLSYQVTGYRVWYGKTSGGPYDGKGAIEGDSPISVPTGTASTFLLSGLSTTVSPPASPVLDPPSVQNESLVLHWSSVSGATGYRVYYDVDDNTPSQPAILADTVRTTSYTLRGLTNNVRYKVAVSSIAQAVYYVAVTAVNTSSTGSVRDVNNESRYSTEAPIDFGDIKESPFSDVKIEFPEAVVPYPNLPNGRKGCFIATAAYGYYGAPEVQALRAFRDRYLLPNRAGRAFVRWYYEHGPVGAAYLDAHPGWKPLVRAALLPAIGAALFMTKTSLFIKILIMLCMLSIVLMTGYRFSVRRDSGSGGVS